MGGFHIINSHLTIHIMPMNFDTCHVLLQYVKKDPPTRQACSFLQKFLSLDNNPYTTGSL